MNGLVYRFLRSDDFGTKFTVELTCSTETETLQLSFPRSSAFDYRAAMYSVDACRHGNSHAAVQSSFTVPLDKERAEGYALSEEIRKVFAELFGHCRQTAGLFQEDQNGTEDDDSAENFREECMRITELSDAHALVFQRTFRELVALLQTASSRQMLPNLLDRTLPELQQLPTAPAVRRKQYIADVVALLEDSEVLRAATEASLPLRIDDAMTYLTSARECSGSRKRRL